MNEAFLVMHWPIIAFFLTIGGTAALYMGKLLWNTATTLAQTSATLTALNRRQEEHSEDIKEIKHSVNDHGVKIAILEGLAGAPSGRHTN